MQGNSLKETKKNRWNMHIDVKTMLEFVEQKANTVKLGYNELGYNEFTRL